MEQKHSVSVRKEKLRFLKSLLQCAPLRDATNHRIKGFQVIETPSS